MKHQTPSQRVITRRIMALLRQANEADRAEGLAWYQDANRFATDLAAHYDLTTYQVATVIALLSPQQSWEQNKLNAAAFLHWYLVERWHSDNPWEGRPSLFATNSQIVACVRAVAEGWRIPATSMKTSAFAENIAEPFRSVRVTVDRHMISIAMGYTDATRVQVTPKRYRMVALAIQRAADKLDLRPHQVQAIAWCTYKRLVGR